MESFLSIEESLRYILDKRGVRRVSTQTKRHIAYGLLLLACLVGAWAVRDWDLAQAACAVGAVMVLCAYAVRSDEVERALATQAGAAAFALLLAAALAVKATGNGALIAAHADDLWAVMVVAAMFCWVVLRIRLG
jgi:hypothetical protein